MMDDTHAHTQQQLEMANSGVRVISKMVSGNAAAKSSIWYSMKIQAAYVAMTSGRQRPLRDVSAETKEKARADTNLANL